jgi:hypothetical protein
LRADRETCVKKLNSAYDFKANCVSKTSPGDQISSICIPWDQRYSWTDCVHFRPVGKKRTQYGAAWRVKEKAMIFASVVDRQRPLRLNLSPKKSWTWKGLK